MALAISCKGSKYVKVIWAVAAALAKLEGCGGGGWGVCGLHSGLYALAAQTCGWEGRRQGGMDWHNFMSGLSKSTSKMTL